MRPDEELTKRLTRLQRFLDRSDRVLDKENRRLEELFLRAVAEWETAKKEKTEAFVAQETQIKSQLDQAGKEYSQTKYRMERDSSVAKNDIKKLDDEYREIEKKYSSELNRLNEERVNFKVSHERQISALTDLYQEKVRSLTVSRAGLMREAQAVDTKIKEAKSKAQREIDVMQEEWDKKIAHIKEQAEAKRDGWNVAIETIKKELGSLNTEKDHLDKRLSEIRGEKEKELEAVKLSISVAREQLEVDKATLIEKAEADQRRCESEVLDLKTKIQSADRELQEFTGRHEQAKKDTEEGFQREETMLKEAVKTEADKRDYEQKLYEQEKAVKEKELNRMREEYEKKKWQWDNQIRSLMMQKAVQDSEFEAERLRVDREARVAFRSLEAKRDELKQRLAELRNRYQSLSTNAQKESELITQRWHWRRDRLWNLWQNRLETLRKERGVLQEQIEAIHQKFDSEHKAMSEAENRENKRLDDTHGFIIQMGDRNSGQKQQREIQNELEKTRVLAQIKECETLIIEWSDRLKSVQLDVAKANGGFIGQMNYLDKWYREEEKETELFLHSLQTSLSTIQSALERLGLRKAA